MICHLQGVKMPKSAETMNPSITETRRLRPGTLQQRLEQARGLGLRTGSLCPLATNYRVIEDHGIHCVVRVLARLQEKEAVKAIEIANKERQRPSRNPFLPYDRDLWVTDFSETHVGVLNKYNVVDHHLLLITRDFEPQLNLLTEADFAASLFCLREVAGLMFYNGGESAGSSQPHKHLQWIPLPLVGVSKGLDLPIDPCFQNLSHDVVLNPVSWFPFVHAAISVEHTWQMTLEEQARYWFTRYQELLVCTGCWDKDQSVQGLQKSAYNLMATRHWMYLVPRRREFVEQISVNSLGFVGAFMVRDNTSYEYLEKIGPFEILQQVGIPRTEHENDAKPRT